MICWECLGKCDVVVTASKENFCGVVRDRFTAKMTCGCNYETRATEAEARNDLAMQSAIRRAEFFKALVASALQGGIAARVPLTAKQFAEDAAVTARFTMSEIERRAEARTLFGGGGREEGA